jgi:hypothetical protein
MNELRDVLIHHLSAANPRFDNESRAELERAFDAAERRVQRVERTTQIVDSALSQPPTRLADALGDASKPAAPKTSTKRTGPSKTSKTPKS